MASVADLVEEPQLRELAGDPAVEARGRQLAGSGAVRLEAFGPVRVTASVEDDGVYRAELSVTSNRLNWSCTCSADSFCAHATAAAIETWQRAPKRRR